MSLSVVLTLAASLLAGLLPALRATQFRPNAALGARATTATDRRGRLAQAVLAAQLAASLVLVVGSGLFARTLWNLNAASSGFDRKTVVYFGPRFSAAVPFDRRSVLFVDALDRLKQSPLVAAVSPGSVPILLGRGAWGYVTRAENYVMQPEEDNSAFNNVASPGYFETLRIPLIYGREFEERDLPPRGQFATTIIVNESFARHYFGTRNPVGATIGWSNHPPPLQIVGVVQDIKSSTLRDGRKDEVYFPLAAGGVFFVIARGAPGVSPSTLEAEIRRVFATVTKEVTLEMAPLEDLRLGEPPASTR